MTLQITGSPHPFHEMLLRALWLARGIAKIGMPYKPRAIMGSAIMHAIACAARIPPVSTRNSFR